MTYTAEQLRAARAKGAHVVWQRNIKEPMPGRVSKEITRLWDALPFWGGWLREPLPDGGGCPNGYTRPPDPNYCLVYVAYISTLVGRWLEPGQCVDVAVHPDLVKYVLTSTRRLANPDKWKEAGFERPEPLGPDEIQPGHIVTVRPTDAKPFGSHGVLAASAPDESGEFHTFEANSRGMRADGSRGKGVVVRSRNIREVARVWPLGPEHHVGRHL